MTVDMQLTVDMYIVDCGYAVDWVTVDMQLTGLLWICS